MLELFLFRQMYPTQLSKGDRCRRKKTFLLDGYEKVKNTLFCLFFDRLLDVILSPFQKLHHLLQESTTPESDTPTGPNVEESENPGAMETGLNGNEPKPNPTERDIVRGRLLQICKTPLGRRWRMDGDPTGQHWSIKLNLYQGKPDNNSRNMTKKKLHYQRKRYTELVGMGLKRLESTG